MTIKNEIKSQLAKLLATEDLIVEHKRVETAQFDVHSRVLTLPVWDASEYVYDMLVSHEVGQIGRANTFSIFFNFFSFFLRH